MSIEIPNIDKVFNDSKTQCLLLQEEKAKELNEKITKEIDIACAEGRFSIQIYNLKYDSAVELVMEEYKKAGYKASYQDLFQQLEVSWVRDF